MLVQLLTGYKSLNWYLTLRSFHYSLYVRCILSWWRALGSLGGLSTGQLNCCLPRMEEKRRASVRSVFFYRASHCILRSMLSPFLVYQPSPHWKSRIAHSGMHLPSVESTPRFIPSASPLMSRFTSSFTCQLISLIITTLIIRHSFTLSLQAQNLPFQ